ncbi:MAG: class I SAM-dependent methyltransferase [Candidatus Kariarchaeaceae archaeon]
MDLVSYYQKIGNSYRADYDYFKLFKSRLPASGKILDLGCANGKLLLVLKNLGYDVVGLDIAQSFVDRAKKLSGCPTFQGRAERMDMFDDEVFDCVISTEVIEHVISPFQALREINRILKPRGKAIISTPNSHHVVRIVFPSHIAKGEILSKHINSFDLAQWKVLFAMCGFKLVWFKGWPNNRIFPRWKGIGRILDRMFRNQERFKQFLFYDAIKMNSFNNK